MRNAIIACSAMMMSFQVMASSSVLINGKEVKSQDDLHKMIAKQLNFPNNYGKNLDALYDVLSTENSGQVVFKIKSVSILKSKIGSDYVDGVIRAITDASADNPKIVLLLE
jgi:ribonuclease inhibitor